MCWRAFQRATFGQDRMDSFILAIAATFAAHIAASINRYVVP